MEELLVKKWDVFLAPVPFEDVPSEKVQPIAIIEETDNTVWAYKLTTHSPRRGEYTLKRWSKAGLKEPTTVRVSKILEIDKSNLIERLGSVDIRDIIEIEKITTS